MRDVPLERQPWTSVAEVARALEPGLLLPDTLQPAELIAAVRATPASEYLVVHADGSLAGILAASDLAAALGPPSDATVNVGPAARRRTGPAHRPEGAPAHGRPWSPASSSTPIAARSSTTT